jgi:hypothetical protein
MAPRVPRPSPAAAETETRTEPEPNASLARSGQDTEYPPHSYGPECRLASFAEPEPGPGLEGIPPIRAQFFYSSALPIDDPGSASAAAGIADSRSSSSKLPLRPFSPADNTALERAWRAFSSDRHRACHSHALRFEGPNDNPKPGKGTEQRIAATVEAIVEHLVAKHTEKHASGPPPPFSGIANGPSVLDTLDAPVCCADLVADVSTELGHNFCPLVLRRHPGLSHDRVVRTVMSRLLPSTLESSDLSGPEEKGRRKSPSVSNGTQARKIADRESLLSQSAGPGVSGTNRLFRGSAGLDLTAAGGSFGLPSSLGSDYAYAGSVPVVRPPAPHYGISGRPFVRVGTEQVSLPSSSPTSAFGTSDTSSVGVATPEFRDSQATTVDLGTTTEVPSSDYRAGHAADMVEAPVGMSRLHTVALPTLCMKPIYWSPVNDVSTVMRATWFYRHVYACMPPLPTVR